MLFDIGNEKNYFIILLNLHSTSQLTSSNDQKKREMWQNSRIYQQVDRHSQSNFALKFRTRKMRRLFFTMTRRDLSP